MVDVFGLVRTWWARLGFGAAALISLGTMLGSKEDWPPSVPALLVFLGTAGAWVMSELPKRAPHPHDIALFEQLMALLSDDYRSLLRNDDFGDPIRAERLNPGYELDRNLIGAKYEFEDKVLSRQLTDVRATCHALSELTLNRLHGARGDASILTVKTDDDLRRGVRSAATIEVTKAMNDLADVLLDQIEKLDKLGRKRLHTVPIQQ